MEGGENKVINFAAHKEKLRLQEKERLAAIKSDIDGLFLDFFTETTNTNLLWFDIDNADTNTIACVLVEDEFNPTHVAIVTDFANFIDSHKPHEMSDYHLVLSALDEDPPRIVFQRSTHI